MTKKNEVNIKIKAKNETGKGLNAAKQSFTDLAVKGLAAMGGLEASIKGATAAVQMFKGDTGAAVEVLKTLPMGIGPVVSSIEQMAIAMGAVRDETEAIARAVADINSSQSGITGSQAFIRRTEQQNRLAGRTGFDRARIQLEIDRENQLSAIEKRMAEITKRSKELTAIDQLAGSELTAEERQLRQVLTDEFMQLKKQQEAINKAFTTRMDVIVREDNRARQERLRKETDAINAEVGQANAAKFANLFFGTNKSLGGLIGQGAGGARDAVMDAVKGFTALAGLQKGDAAGTAAQASLIQSRTLTGVQQAGRLDPAMKEQKEQTKQQKRMADILTDIKDELTTNQRVNLIAGMGLRRGN